MYPLITTPHPALRQATKPVGDRLDASPQSWRDLAAALRQTMVRHDGIGIAAPQIAMRSRLCVLRDGNTLIDPVIVERSETTVDSTEGCLSLPGEQWTVTRSEWVRYAYRDLEGHEHTKQAFGLEALIVQHELDHLDGVLLDERARAAADRPGGS